MKQDSLLPSALIGAVASARSMTPMATIAAARLAHRGTPGELFLLDRPLFKYGALAMGAGELYGDKMKSAPDRIVGAGLTARFITSAIAGASLAPRRNRLSAAMLGGATAVVASYPGWRTRVAMIPRYGQTPTGLVEDAIVLGSAMGILLSRARAAVR